MAKRKCTSLSRVSETTDPTDRLLESFLALSNSDPLSLSDSFDLLIERRNSDTEQTDLIEQAKTLASVLREAAFISERKRSQRHNSIAWSIPFDVTIKIFSMMDTKNVINAAATCSFFRKCAEDPLCYSNIDLTTENSKVYDIVVLTMIHRAGKSLRSLRLGLVHVNCISSGGSQSRMNITGNSADASGFSCTDKRYRQGKESFFLTRFCLSSLSDDGGAHGALLRRLHLFNIERMDDVALGTALSACPSLLDLEVVHLHVQPSVTLKFVSNNCHLIERLHVESSKIGRSDTLRSPLCCDLVSNCPRLTSLALKGFNLDDRAVRIFIQGFQKLKYADFSTSSAVSGSFLRNFGTGGRSLEVLMLRDCTFLRRVDVSQFLNAVIGGNFELLRHFDISKSKGMEAGNNWFDRCSNISSLPIEQLLETRPGFCLVVEFPQESDSELEELNNDDLIAVTNSPSEISGHSSDDEIYTTSSDNSSNSDSYEWGFFGD